MITKLIIKEGRNLTPRELKVINEWRMKEFNSKSFIKPKQGNEDWNKRYFLLLNENGEIVAFARLHEVNLEFLGKEYAIFGLATLISIERGKGYGEKLTLEMKKFIEKSGKTGVGFCDKKLTDFYRKCGFGNIKDGVSRFLYKNEEGNLLKDTWGGGDVIYLEGEDKLIELIINNPKEIVISYRQHW
jgi:predicted GNAT family N-acyltransferase